MRTCPACRRRRPRRAKSEANQAYADTTFEKEWKTSVGNETVSAKYYGPAHTSGDIVITFERANVVHMGDLMSFQRNPRADRPAGASIRNWIPVLENTVKDHSADTIYIFGHSKVGERVTGSSQDLLGAARLLHRDAGLRAQGRSPQASRWKRSSRSAAVPGFESYEGTPTALEVAYQELTAKP